MVDGLIASKAERIAQLLERRNLPAMVRDLLARW